MYDVAIIGAGVVGSAIARELSRYEVKACVIEREEDVCSGTSKANSAIIHAGFDAAPGTLKAKLNVQGNAMMDALAKELDIPFTRNGSLVICTEDQDASELDRLMDQARANGVPGTRIVEREELLAMEPNVSDDAVKAFYAPTGGIVCPFHMTMAFAENAYVNGVEFFLNTEVEKLERIPGGYRLQVGRRGSEADAEPETIESRVVVNAAGVYADVFNNMVSRYKIKVVARKGEYMLLDKTAGGHVIHTIFQLPGKMGKGVLVTPTVHGNLLVGPTAKEEEDKEGVNTTADGLEELSRAACRSVKNIPFREVITSFAGMRAHIAERDAALMGQGAGYVLAEQEQEKGTVPEPCSVSAAGAVPEPCSASLADAVPHAGSVFVPDAERTGDFLIGESPDAEGFYNAAGIESPGLSSAPAIGGLLAAEIAGKLGLSRRKDFQAERKGILRPDSLSREERNALIREQPAYGSIICRCEMVTEGEILDAIRRPLGARSLDAVKRRTRAGMGRCQSGFCSPRTMELLERETGLSRYEITKNGGRSAFVVGLNKEVQG